MWLSLMHITYMSHSMHADITKNTEGEKLWAAFEACMHAYSRTHPLNAAYRICASVVFPTAQLSHSHCNLFECSVPN